MRSKNFNMELGLWRALWHAFLNTLAWFFIQIVCLPRSVNWILLDGVGGLIFVLDIIRVIIHRRDLIGKPVWKWALRAEKWVAQIGIIREKERATLSAGGMNIAGMAILYAISSDTAVITANCLLWLGWGDPAARILGLWLGGKRRSWLCGKTVEGCMAFLIFGTLGSLLTSAYTHVYTIEISFFGAMGISLSRLETVQFILALGLFIAMITEVYSDLLEIYTRKIIHGWDNLLVLVIPAMVMNIFM